MTGCLSPLMIHHTSDFTYIRLPQSCQLHLDALDSPPLTMIPAAPVAWVHHDSSFLEPPDLSS